MFSERPSFLSAADSFAAGILPESIPGLQGDAMLVAVGDKSSELTPVAFCAPDRIPAMPVEDLPAKHPFPVLFVEAPPFPRRHAKSRQPLKDNQ